ncbi:AI-2E family transporter [Carboxydochorda subterranea]|uniref:AI-2E family transporter n=1 Tax=Carboxydichorda subterranea TaxID=3109565 RepID=A0ABZ1C1X6_9FIRM|nr:AI-2E family transporter [Limnochorda sp. L945t]WRP18307.1 AI-2E family transporter [Limnochorda sp. L945t]
MGERRFWYAAGLVGLALLIVVWRLRAVATPFVLALVVAYLLEPLVALLETRQVPRGPAILIVYLALGLLLSLLWVSVVPSVVAEVDNLARRLPSQSQQWNAAIGEMLGRLRLHTLPEVVQNALNAAVGRIEGMLTGFASRLAALLVSTLSQVLNLILTPVLAYYILKDRDRLAEGIVTVIPASVRRRAVELALEIDRTLAAVIRGQLLVSMSIGALVAAGLVLLKVRYALVLGLLAGLLDIVPYFGPVAAGIPIVLLSLANGPWTAVWAVVLLVAANQIEGALLQPRVMSRSSGLHPLVVIAAVLAGAELAGIFGMLLAVPVASVGRTTLLFFLRPAAGGGPAPSPPAGPPARPAAPAAPAAPGRGRRGGQRPH